MNKRKKSTGGLVYSTDHGEMCPACSQAIAQCSCTPDDSAPEGDGIVRVHRETKGRKGKGVSVVRGLTLSRDELSALSKELKKKTSSGGTVKGWTIEIQGDHVELLIRLLSDRGWTVKKSGA